MEIEELTAEHLGPHCRPHRRQPGRCCLGEGRLADHVVRPGQREVAEQDGDRITEVGRVARPRSAAMPIGEGDVHRRPTAPGMRRVDDVVVNQRARLNQLERGTDPQHDRGIRTGRVASGAQPTGPCECRPNALAATEHELFQVVDRNREIAADRIDGRPAGFEEFAQRSLESRGQGRRLGRDGDNSRRQWCLLSDRSSVARLSNTLTSPRSGSRVRPGTPNSVC